MKFKIKDLCSYISSGGTPSRNVKEYYHNGTINWIKTQELNDNNIYTSEEKITELGLKNSSAKIFPPNTVTMAMYGATVGKLGILKVESATNQACCNMIADPDKLHYKFLFYSLLYNRDRIISLANGAAQQNLNKKTIEEYEIDYFPLEEQKNIVSILSSLDEKIELNNQINKNLEEMAQAIFKSWFVDFEPFQDGEFVESELGMIPKGWEVKQLGDVIELAYGKALKKDDRIEGPYPVYGSNGVVGTHNSYLVKGPGIVVGRKGNPGTVTYVFDNFYPIDTTFYVIPKDNLSSLIYLFYALQKQNLANLSADSAVPGLNRNIAYKNFILIPPKEILEKFTYIVQPLFDYLSNNTKQVKKLSTLRDTLLPKLMSGEIRVPLDK